MVKVDQTALQNWDIKMEGAQLSHIKQYTMTMAERLTRRCMTTKHLQAISSFDEPLFAQRARFSKWASRLSPGGFRVISPL